jgi:hypothetical protein
VVADARKSYEMCIVAKKKNKMAQPYEEVYYSALLDDLHNFFPAILYHPARFSTVSDLTHYIQSQMNEHFNTYDRSRRAYERHHGFTTIPFGPNGQRATILPPPIGPTPNQRPRVAVGMTTETIDLTPLFTTNLRRQTTGGGLGARLPGGDLEDIATEFQIPTILGGAAGGGGILDQLANLLTRAAEPVVVAPTAQQIERATTIRVPSSTEENDASSCAICQDPLYDELLIRPLREIIHCEHAFHQTCIDRWFTRNVRCPVCRFDIRDHETPTQSP